MERRTSSDRGRGTQRGFTLVEVLVAITVFAIIALAAYAVYDAARWSFERGNQAADAQQRTRIAFDRMISDVRLAGYDYNSDGDQTPYSDQADEQLEYLGPTAVAFRANFDYEDNQQGREYDGVPPSGTDPNSGAFSGYETSVQYLEANKDKTGFPVVTTANDEIVVYALTKPGANDKITLKLDTSKPRNAEDTEVGKPGDGEETVTICQLALTHDDPPYTLMRISLKDQNIQATGTNCLATNLQVRTPLAEDIRSMDLAYYDENDSDSYCVNPNTQTGTCAASDEVPFVDVGGDDGLQGSSDPKAGRRARSDVRRISVEIKGMTQKADFRYTDPEEPDLTKPFAKYRKVRYQADINPPNLGKVGQLDLGAVDPSQVKNVSACSGQCGFVRAEWDENPKEEQILGYVVDLYRVQCVGGDIIAKVTSKFVTGNKAYNEPGRLYTTFNASDDSELLRQARLANVDDRDCLSVQIYAKNVNGVDGQRSDSGPPDDGVDDPTLLQNEPGAEHASKLYDETRPDPVSGAEATGVDPATYSDANGVPDTNPSAPETSAGSKYYPKVNRIELEWMAPSWTLDEVSNDPVTRVDSGTDPSLPVCHTELDNAGSGKARTPLEEVQGLAQASADLTALHSIVPDSDKQGRYLIFRSAEPNFAPRAENLIAVVDSPSYVDRTVHHFSSQGGTTVFRYTEAFPVQNCVQYYYRFRVADDCWDGTKPAGNDPINGDYGSDHLSPFYPPLNRSNPDDTDDLTGGGTVGAAVIGYARPDYRPEQVQNLRLDAYSHDADRKFFISFDLPKVEASGDPTPDPDDTDHIAIGAIRVYGHPSNKDFALPANLPTCLNPPCSNGIGGGVFYYGEVDLHTDPTGARSIDVTGDGTQTIPANKAGILGKRIAHDDENGNDAGPLTPPAEWHVELPFEDESSYDAANDGSGADDSGDTGLLFHLHNSSSNPWYIKVAAVQCKDPDGQTFVTGDNEDDGYSSTWLKVPCDFGEAINGNSADGSGGTVANSKDPIDSDPSAQISINGGSCPNRLPSQITATVTDDQGDPRACQARLVLRSGGSGDVVSSGWKFWADPGTCNEIGTSCPKGQSFWSSNEFCWTSDEVRSLMEQLRGQDIQVTVEARESIPLTDCSLFGEDNCITVWPLPCVGSETCTPLVLGDNCLLTVPVEVGTDHSTRDPVTQSDDFTGGVDPISGEPNGLPDGVDDCYQAVQWTFEESCANGNLDISQIRMRWKADPLVTGSCSPKLLRAYWDWDEASKTGVEIYRSSGWPTDGDNSPAVGCEEGGNCPRPATCIDPGPEGCLFAEEGQQVVIRLEFDTSCDVSAKNIQLELTVDYDRTTVGGGTNSVSQVFDYAPTTEMVPDLCNPCDQDNDGFLSKVGESLDGTSCNTLCTQQGNCDCDETDPNIGAAANCCDADADGYFRLGTLYDGTNCGNPNNGTCDNTGSQPFNDCDDSNSAIHPGFQETIASGLCTDGIDNDCDCAVDGVPKSEDLLECLF